jgi:gliding motility-associated-like protein
MEKKLLLNTLAMFLGINTILAQAPSINYNVSNVFTQNTLISPLSPVNTGGGVPAVAAYGQVSLFAGDISNSGSADGIGSAARFNNPYGITADSSGNLYVADRNNHKIRKITSAGVVSTLAGSGTVGNVDAIGSAASFNNPIGVTVDASGNVYVADFANHKIRKITSAGVVTTFVGSGTAGEVDGSGIAASFSNPMGIAADGDGNIYVGDLTGGRKIRKITSVGTVSTIAGSEGGYLDSSVPLNARFNAPSDIVLDGNGNLYIADNASHNIRKMVLPAGEVSTFAGCFATCAGSADGTGEHAKFNLPYYLTRDKAGNFYIADRNNYSIRKISTEGIVTTLAGVSGTSGFADGIGSAAKFGVLAGIVADNSGSLYVVNAGRNIRKISITGYTISPALPAGLTFNGITGTISGTPTVIFPSTDYTITAFNAYGSSTANINIIVEAPLQLKDDPNLKVPNGPSGNNYLVSNVITPNGDGINDTWIINDLHKYPDNEVRVLDKSGRIVFYQKAYDNTWNATFNGSSLSEGAYYYQVNLGNGKDVLKGMLNIIIRK